MTRIGVAVRKAALHDLDAIVELALEAREESALTAQVCTPSPDVLRQQLAGALQTEDMRLLVADLDGAAIGFGLARLVRPGLFYELGWLRVEAFYVARNHRRRGAGHALMAAIVRLAADEGAQRVVTTPLSGARTEQRFLARLGFAHAAGHRVAETAALLRRLELELVPRERRRSRGLDSLIAARRRFRDAEEAAAPFGTGVPDVLDDGGGHVTLAAG